MEEFLPIDDFPGYSVGNLGTIVNNKTATRMHRSPNENGELTVGLMRDGTQHRRSIKVLVAKAFVQGEDVVFNTPIIMDGNREHIYYDNIVWRPRWFAIAYTKQFDNIQDWWFAGPIRDLRNEDVYRDVHHAIVVNGILGKDIWNSVTNGSIVFPTRQRFEFT